MAPASKFARLATLFAALLILGCTQPPITREDMIKRSSFAEITAYFWDLNQDEKLPQNYHGMSDQAIVFQDFKNERTRI